MKSLAQPLDQVDRTYVWFRRRKLSYFGGCDYFRLSSRPEVTAAFKSGLKRYGLTVAASRKTTGNHVLYERLEKSLAEFFGAADAVLISNGYATNTAVAQALAGRFSRVLIDERAHASLADAAVFFGCPTICFPYRDAGAVGRIVRRSGRKSRLALLTDGMFAHNGELAPLAAYLSQLPGDAMVLVDDAHGAGVLGRGGRGTAEELCVRSSRIIQTISLSKAFGVYGGAVLGSRAVCERIRTASRLFGGNTPPLLPLAAAALAAVELLKREPVLLRRLHRNVNWVRTGLRGSGMHLADSPGPIVSVTPKRAGDAELMTGRLLARGVYPSFIRYPVGAKSGYFRFAISSEHRQVQLESLVSALLAGP
jgi:7-keto-8-aminopelargonate synthetase-like enzyme